MREALYPSGAKDDPRDADLLLDLLLQHRDKLRRLTPDNEATRRVQNLVEERRKLVEEKTAQLNRLSGYLKVYFPQMLEWFAKLDTKLACEFLENWPSLEELQSSSPAEVRKFFHRRRGRHGELTEWRTQGIGQAMTANTSSLSIFPLTLGLTGSRIRPNTVFSGPRVSRGSLKLTVF